MPNYCKDCAHFRLGLGSNPVCAKFSGVEQTEDLVWGVRETRHQAFCDIERRETGKCGPDAKGFTPIDYAALMKPPMTRQAKIMQWFR